MNDLLVQLRDKGNTVLVVEHEPETIEIADHVVDLGPGAGTAGGEVVFEGSVEELRGSDTLTGKHLDDRSAVKSEFRPRPRVSRFERQIGTISKTSTSTYRSMCWSSSPVSPGRARAPSSRAPYRMKRVLSWSTRPRLRIAAQQPSHLYRDARLDPEGIRQGQRCEAGAVQSQLRRCLSELQWRRCHLHRAGLHGHRCHHLRGMRWQAVRSCSLEYELGGKDISQVFEMSVTDAEDFFSEGESRCPPPTPSWNGCPQSGLVT